MRNLCVSECALADCNFSNERPDLRLCESGGHTRDREKNTRRATSTVYKAARVFVLSIRARPWAWPAPCQYGREAKEAEADTGWLLLQVSRWSQADGSSLRMGTLQVAQVSILGKLRELALSGSLALGH